MDPCSGLWLHIVFIFAARETPSSRLQLQSSLKLDHSGAAVFPLSKGQDSWVGRAPQW